MLWHMYIPIRYLYCGLKYFYIIQPSLEGLISHPSVTLLEAWTATVSFHFFFYIFSFWWIYWKYVVEGKVVDVVVEIIQEHFRNLVCSIWVWLPMKGRGGRNAIMLLWPHKAKSWDSQIWPPGVIQVGIGDNAVSPKNVSLAILSDF